MSHLIISVDPRSPADRAGIRAGDRLARIDGAPVIDFIDYQALTANRRLTVQVLRDAQWAANRAMGSYPPCLRTR